MRVKILCIVFILGLLNLSAFAAQQEQEFFPLSEGNYWIYSGNVKWTNNEGKEESKAITWKMQVEKRMKHVGYDIAVVNGLPDDLCWYAPEMKPARNLIAWKGNRYFMIPVNDDYEKLIGDKSYLAKQLKQYSGSIFLVKPLKKNLVFGKDRDNKNTGTMYAWYVDAVSQTSLADVSGIKLSKAAQVYSLSYKTNADMKNVEYVPSVGITMFSYQHHGTVSEVEVKLIEYRAK